MYDADLKLKFNSIGLNIKEMIEVNDTYYCELEAGGTPETYKDDERKDAKGNYPSEIVSGIYMFNLQRMMDDGEIEL